MVPFTPTLGVVQVKAGPVSWVSDTKVVPAGSGSDRPTVWAADGPAFEIDSVYVRLLPAITVVGVTAGFGPSPSSLVTDTSAERLTGVVSVALLLAATGSEVPLVATVAVFDTEAPVKEAS